MFCFSADNLRAQIGATSKQQPQMRVPQLGNPPAQSRPQAVPQTSSVQPSAQRVIAFDLGPGGKLSVQDSAFKVGSAALEPNSLPFFNALGEYLMARPDLEIEIRGHASSEGDAAKNLQLSKERAEGAKKYLMERFGILPGRIRTQGFGDSRPLKSNTDEKGRSQNRRVEIVGVSSVTQQALTTESGKAAEGIGKISTIQNKVQLRAPWELDFHTARSNDAVYEYHRINTGENSRAEITFTDNSKIQISENTSMLIYSPSKDRASDKPQENVRLFNGNMFVKLNGKGMVVKTSGSAIEFDSTNAGNVTVDSNQRSTVSVFEGSNAKIKLGSGASDSTVEVEKGFGFSMQGGNNTVRRIPATPELLAPDRTLAELLAVPSPVLFQWVHRAPLTRLEVANDPSFTSLVYRHVFQTGDSVSMSLDSGQYYYRIASIDDYGIESKPIEGVLMIAGTGKGFVFRAMGFAMFLFSAVLLWVSILINTPFQARYINSWAVEGNNLQFTFTENMNHLMYRIRSYALDHRSLLLIMRSIAALSALIATYMVW
ncbi:MAG: OmpA family protein [Ignavibacteria bacterium]|nr:OmpA family protein [Ignavibacteria bacterium]